MKPKSVDYSFERSANKNEEGRDSRMMGEGKLLWWEQLEHAVERRRNGEETEKKKEKIQAINSKTAFPSSSSQTHDDPKTSMNRKGWNKTK